ncbi:type II toxin-antitoxin system RelE/ParE family toxin [Chryseobacterium scophthalmum]|uniref:Plasmid stabilization system protein ParE n=1 Tax=Chryseobacterium scophthalmum TaxID=59733 RepID=A0A1N6G3K9_9FLAO|nr:type II toxin-antitoxin system RelE/ParE family toxin [Chryseobacterium scophthalmum]SIO02129.1 Plasmid stabilization system protein ParE [Chryseobacterium scophthalmum]
MGLEIFWTQFAEDKLYDIFQYYKFKAGIKIAKKIINEIVDKTLILEQNNKAGQIEELLIERKQDFRYLVSGNYKIIYYINVKTNKVIIANVFDSRQNPLKLKETK